MEKQIRHFLSGAILRIAFFTFIVGLTATSTLASELPSDITFATQRAGTVFYIHAVGMAKIITKHTPMKCIIQPMGFIRQWGPAMERGDVQISSVAGISGYAYHYGALWWKDQPSHPSIMQLNSGLALKFGIFVRADSEIHTIRDLMGKKFYARLPAAPSMMYIVNPLFEFYNIPKGSVKILTITSFAEAVQEVIDRRADAVMTTLGAAFPKINRAGGARVLPISKEAASYVAEKSPFFDNEIVPAGYLGLPKDTLLMTMQYILTSSKDVPAEITYTVLKAIYDHYDELKSVHASAKEWSLDRALQSKVIPYHSGAIKFFKEKGLWTQELENFQKNALSKSLMKK